MDLKKPNPVEEVEMVVDKTLVDMVADMTLLEKKAVESESESESESVRSMNLDDMIQEILLRLPVTSLVRCEYQGVPFLPTSPQGTSTMLIKTRRSDDDGDYNETLDDELLSFLGHPRVYLLGSSNGFLLTCPEETNPKTYYICNPINKQSLALPQPKTTSQSFIYGFICHTTHPSIDMVHSYKVVRIPSPPGVDQHNLVTTRTIEILSSNFPEWKLFHVTCPYPFRVDVSFFSSLIIMEQQGLIYIPVTVEKEASHLEDEGFLIYDQRKECSQFMDGPPRLVRIIECYCPSVFGVCNGDILFARHELGQLQVWVLDEKEDSTREWCLKHKVRLEVTPEKCPQFVKSALDEVFEIDAFHPINPQIIFLGIGERKVLFELDTLRMELICELSERGRHDLSFPYMYGLIGPHLFLED